MALSACWIVKNEAEVLARSIESIKDVVDDLVVVDTGSTDNTVDIARSLGARVEHFTWIDDFAAARNYALSFVKNDIVFFLDADEWFEPALAPDDAQPLENIFLKNSRIDMAQFVMTHINEKGATITVTEQARLLRKRPDLGFLSPIHEYYGSPSGRSLVEITISDKAILHTGYVTSVRDEKLMRNVELLKRHVASTDNINETFLSYVYLVREHYQTTGAESAWPYLRIVLDYPGLIRQRARGRNYVPLVDYLVQCSCELPDKVSRREVKDKLFEAQAQGYAEYPGAPLSLLWHTCVFDLKEDVVMQSAPRALARSHAMPDFPTKLYKAPDALLNATVAFALDRRGDALGAFDHAVASIKASKKYAVPMTVMLLKCMRGQQPQDIVIMLSQLFDIENIEHLQFLTEATHRTDFLEVYAYYQVRLLKETGVSRVAQVELLYTQRRYAEALEAVLKIAVEEGEEYNERITTYLMAIAVCTNDPTLHLKYAHIMPSGARMMEAYFADIALTERTEAEDKLFPLVYKQIALVEGAQAANDFGRVFRNFPILTFTTRAPYLLNDWQYQALLNDPLDGIPDNDYVCYTYIIHANIYAGRYEEAFFHIRRFLSGQQVVDDVDLLHALLVISEKSKGVVAREARALYDRHMRFHDALVDYGDVVKSGYAVDEYTGKNRLRKLRIMSMDSFLQQLKEEDAGRLITNELLEIALKAGAIYEEKKMAGMAMECYRLAYTHESHRAAAAKKLAGVFRAIGNEALARTFEIESGEQLPAEE